MWKFTLSKAPFWRICIWSGCRLLEIVNIYIIWIKWRFPFLRWKYATQATCWLGSKIVNITESLAGIKNLFLSTGCPSDLRSQVRRWDCEQARHDGRCSCVRVGHRCPRLGSEGGNPPKRRIRPSGPGEEGIKGGQEEIRQHLCVPAHCLHLPRLISCFSLYQHSFGDRLILDLLVLCDTWYLICNLCEIKNFEFSSSFVLFSTLFVMWWNVRNYHETIYEMHSTTLGK